MCLIFCHLHPPRIISVDNITEHYLRDDNWASRVEFCVKLERGRPDLTAAIKYYTDLHPLYEVRIINYDRFTELLFIPLKMSVSEL